MNKKSNIWVWLIIVTTISGTCKKDDAERYLVTDIDGNIYHTVTIGAQVCMSENLRATRYSDGTNIPMVKILNEHEFSIDIYGRLYSWSAAMKGAVSSNAKPSGVQGACLTDWHLPSDSEWKELAVYLGGDSIAGGKMKEVGLTHWAAPNGDATNENGFSGLPGDFRASFGSFDPNHVGWRGCW